MKNILKNVFGSEEADRLLTLRDKCLLVSNDIDATVRRDLNNLDANENWFGYSFQEQSTDKK